MGSRKTGDGVKNVYTRDFDSYDQDLRSRWDPSPSDPWDSYLGHAPEYLGTGQLASQELNYKCEMSRKLAAAREAVLSESNDRAIRVKRELASNLIYYRNQQKLRGWIDKSPDDTLKALRSIWTGDDSSISEQIRAFSELLPYSLIGGSGTRMNVAAVLLMGIDVERYPPFRVGVFNDAYKRTGYDPPPEVADEAALYEHALGFLKRFIREAQTRGLPVRHRLDAQSLVWAIRNTGRVGGLPIRLPISRAFFLHHQGRRGRPDRGRAGNAHGRVRRAGCDKGLVGSLKITNYPVCYLNSTPE